MKQQIKILDSPTKIDPALLDFQTTQGLNLTTPSPAPCNDRFSLWQPFPEAPQMFLRRDVICKAHTVGAQHAFRPYVEGMEDLLNDVHLGDG